MTFDVLLPTLLGLAWLLPLASFALIVLFGPRMGRGGHCAGYLATAAIVLGFVLSLVALGAWLVEHPLGGNGDGPPLCDDQRCASVPASGPFRQMGTVPSSAPAQSPAPLAGNWYLLGKFGSLEVTIGYYIDALTIAMFCMVTLIASCIHVYSFGYMHEELEEVTDPLVTLADGRTLRRRGRFHRFFQYLSLFCFSMLGLVIAGNLAMVFAFWELVGICSYLLIGFYIERRTASNAANKAFIVNRIGDFGMIVGLMAIWTGMGTFSFGDVPDVDGRVRPGIFSQVRPAESGHAPQVPDRMVLLAAKPHEAADAAGSNESLSRLRGQGYGYWLLVVAGLGIFCGCVGKSAQFPLHVWLPDAMEGPTPVSALIHAATMVAAGVYLVGRFYPVFTPDVLLVIAYVGCITLFIAATIAIAATDIKRVLAYSTVSQLGYMMLALGVGGWLAGMFHLFTHAFFKALLFLCSGSVIHATGTNEMPRMGGLLKKMPWTAGTMLVGCMAIAGAGIPLVIGLSGYYSKDYIIAQALLFRQANALHGMLYWVPVLGAGITAFYMFRLWFMTFAGRPRDEHVYHHAHESPRAMLAPLVILAVFAVGVAWTVPGTGLGLEPILKQAEPLGIAEGVSAGWPSPQVTLPSEHEAHKPENYWSVHARATFVAFGAAMGGFLLATVFYGLRVLDPYDVQRRFARTYRFLVHKWYFDELYGAVFVRPTLRVAGWVAALDKKGIDGLADGSARLVTAIARLDDWIDRVFVDRAVNRVAQWTYAVGIRLRGFQTGNVRQYVMFVAVGTVALSILAKMFWSFQTHLGAAPW